MGGWGPHMLDVQQGVLCHQSGFSYEAVACIIDRIAYSIILASVEEPDKDIKSQVTGSKFDA